jgi:hypothetical protein
MMLMGMIASYYNNQTEHTYSPSSKSTDFRNVTAVVTYIYYRAWKVWIFCDILWHAYTFHMKYHENRPAVKTPWHVGMDTECMVISYTVPTFLPYVEAVIISEEVKCHSSENSR